MAKSRLKLAGATPFGIGQTKPQHFREMMRIIWENRDNLDYAFRILNDGVCDGCALGTSGMKDWTIDGTHLCLVRLNLLRWNTMGAFKENALADVSKLKNQRADVLRKMGRIPFPMRRRKGEAGFSRISWDDFYAEAGDKFSSLEPDRMACYMTSRGITNEVYFAAQKAWRAMGSPHIDNAARLCHSPSTAAMKQTLGVAAATCSYRDLYKTDVIVFFGSNPANDQPVMLKYLYEAKKRGAKVLVVNTYDEPGMENYWIPSNADSAVFGTKIADRFFRVTTGGDLAFVYAVQKVLIGRKSVNTDFIDAHTEGWDEYVRDLAHLELGEVVARSGATLADVIAFADEIETASKGVFIWSMGITQHTHGSEGVAAICTLGLSQGFVGSEGNGLMPIRGHSGVQGGAEMGAYATVFPGRAITEEGADELEALWGFRPPAEVGMNTTQMLRAAERDELDLLYAVGGNFRGVLPQPDQVDAALEKIPYRIHQDIFLTPQMFLDPTEAVYLLPARTRYEHRDGVTETTTERRVIFSPHVPGHEVGEAREEWRILLDFGAAVRPENAASLKPNDAHELRKDISATIPAYAQISSLQEKGDFFQRGGERTCEGGKFPTADGKAHFVFYEPPDRRLPKGHFWMATRRGKQFNSAVQAEVDHLTGAARDHVFLSSKDIDELGLKQDQKIRVYNDFGSYEGRVFEAPIVPGNLQMHWPEANILLDPEAEDRQGFVPDYNAAVRVEAIG